MNRWLWIVGAPMLIAGCAIDEKEAKTSKTSAESLVLSAATRVGVEAVLEFGSTIFAENPSTRMDGSDFHGYEFDGKAGGIVTITMNANICPNGTVNSLDTLLDLFGPEDANGNRGAQIAENDDAGLAPCGTDARIANFRLPIDGTYLIVATSFLQQGGGANTHYKLTLTCNNGACVLPGAPTFASTRILQTDIDKGLFTPDDLFEIGDFLFELGYQTKDGMGNALTGTPANNQPRPNFRPFPNNVHFAAFGAPEAQSCVGCHNVGGDDGAGDLLHNIFQIGDGINPASGVPRNPPPLLGSGLRQRAGEEMTAELTAQLTAARNTANTTNTNVTVNLNSKTVGFGTIIAKPGNVLDVTGLGVGIDPPVAPNFALTVKPFGWKGREATIRRFIEGGFRVHFGMQTEPSVNNHCTTPNVNTFGNGPNCQDPDNDGVTKEISDGQLSAEAAYVGMLGLPQRIPAINAAAQTRVNQGEALFNQVFCGGCHRQNIKINVPVHVEKGDTTTGAGISINLVTDTRDPKPVKAADGSITAEIWSDFKRHDMGPSDCDSKAFNQIGACIFVTPPLWGIRDTAPYLHDGRAPTLLDSILMHGDGEDAFSVGQFKALSADDQQKIIEFMLSLGRPEDKGAAKVDLSNFFIEQLEVKNNNIIEFRDGFFPPGTLVQHEGLVIVARNATKAQFEAFYGKTLGAHVSFFTGGNTFPVIDGGETMALFDFQGVFLDGRSFPEAAAAGQTLKRVRCDLAAPLSTSWTIAGSTPAVATPGAGPLITGQNRICVSEVADSPTNSNFEYVELLVE